MTAALRTNDHVILVDEKDNELGILPKMEAHEKGLLHRAFSVFILNDKNELLLQKRASHKYHSPGLWSNTCCSHPQKGESNTEAGERRLEEELGFSTSLQSLFSFIYKSEFDNGLTEHELDHVLIGKYNNAPELNPEEVEDWKWINLQELQLDMSLHPENYTIWFKIVFPKYMEHIQKYA